jgi:cytochrome c oxidase assembly factor CtaG
VDLSSLLTQWSFEPLVTLGLLASAFLYVRGLEYSLRHGIGKPIPLWRVVCFFAGLFILLIALESVIDVQAAQLLWVHMIQHDLLAMVAPPLLLLGLPLWPVWRGVPRRARVASLRWALKQPGVRRVSMGISHLLGRPRVALVLFTGSFVLWHLPVLYDLALEQPTVHIAEHLTFLGTALLFWAQVIPARPVKGTVSYPMQALYLCVAALVLNVLGGVFVFSTGPLYPYYAALRRGAQSTPLLIDQHLAGAAMDIPGTFIFFTVIIIILWRWLEGDEREAAAETSRTATLSRFGPSGVPVPPAPR